LVPFLVTFCGTTKSNCLRGMSANSKKKKSPIPRTKPGHRRIDRGTTKRTVGRLRHERKLKKEKIFDFPDKAGSSKNRPWNNKKNS
jgi:hypothetical protein